MRNQILVHWRNPHAYDGCADQQWYQWSSFYPKQYSPQVNSPFRSHTVMEILRFAFQENLSRNVGWDISLVDEEWVPDFLEAARVYRRGVQVRKSNIVYPSTSLPDGTHSVDFFETVDATIEVLGSGLESLTFVDKNVLKAWPNLLRLQNLVQVDVSEGKKDLALVATIEGIIRQYGKSSITFIGGGVMLDSGAFAASLAGCEMTLIPTSLLAMADASVGGKTGVNFPPYGKNQIGTFYFPKNVFICREWLQSLPDAHFGSGLAECFKHAFLMGDRDVMASLELGGKNSTLCTEALLKVISYKIRIIEEDPFERRKRAILNFGHTLGHALESVSQEISGLSLSHGQAVALGMVFAGLVSMDKVGLNPSEFELIHSSLRNAGCLPDQRAMSMLFNVPKLWPRVFDLMLHDKKMQSRSLVSMVLLSRIGQPWLSDSRQYLYQLDEKTLQKSWKSFMKLMQESHL